MIIYMAIVEVPDSFSYDGTTDRIVSIHTTYEGAEKAAKNEARTYFPTVDWRVSTESVICDDVDMIIEKF